MHDAMFLRLSDKEQKQNRIEKCPSTDVKDLAKQLWLQAGQFPEYACGAVERQQCRNSCVKLSWYRASSYCQETVWERQLKSPRQPVFTTITKAWEAWIAWIKIFLSTVFRSAAKSCGGHTFQRWRTSGDLHPALGARLPVHARAAVG